MAAIVEPPLHIRMQDEQGNMDISWVQWFDTLHKETNDNRSKISTKTLATSASAVFNSGITSANKKYEIELLDVECNSLNSRLLFLASTDAGVSYLEGGSSYLWSREDNGTITTSSADTKIPLTLSTLSNDSTYRIQGTVTIIDPGATKQTYVLWKLKYINSSDVIFHVDGVGKINTTTAINGFKLYPSSGSFRAGTIKLYSLQ